MWTVRGGPVRLGRRVRQVVLLGLGLLVLAGPVAAKSYGIPHVAIEARLGGDGSLSVKESRTYAFEGRFRFAFRTLPTSHGETYDAIRVSESGNAFRLADTGEPGTFQVTPGADAVEVRWFFQGKPNHTFDLEYRVQPVAQRHADAAVLYYQFIGGEWAITQRDVRVRVQPPVPVAPDSVRAWLHGPLWGEVGLDPDGGITATCARVPPRVAFEIRALFPPATLPDVPVAPGMVREGVMQEEARWAADANRLRAEAQQRIAARAARRSLGWRVLPLIGLAGIVGGYLLWRARGTRPVMPESSAQALVSAPPAETPPAFVGYLLHDRQVSGADLTATIFDLARREFLVLQEGRAERRQLFGGTRTVPTYTLVLKRDALRQNASQLLPHESALLAFIFDGLAKGGDTIEMGAIKKQQSRMARFFATWSRQVKSEARARDYFDAESVRGYHYALALGIGLLLLTIPAVLGFGLAGVSLAVAGVVVLVLSWFIPHRTQQGEMEARQWKGLKRYLQNYGAPGVAPTDSRLHLDAFLVYGVVLGLGAKAYRTLVSRLAPESSGAFVPWYVAHGGSGGFDAESFAGAFSSMVATATSTVSSASGTGGGASGGGGGGAGGGGGGAG